MTEQERPRTAAGRLAWDDVSELEPHHRIRVRGHFLAIEAEGRQEADDAMQYVRDALNDDRDHSADYIAQAFKDAKVAGLNASESPHFHRRRVSEFSTAEYDAPCYLVHEGDASESPPMMLDVKDLRDAIIRVVGVEIDMVDAGEIAQFALADSIEAEAVGDASESRLTMTDANSEALAGPCPGGCGCRLYSPDADPKDCGCDSYCTMDTTDWPKWSADASESGQPHDPQEPER